MVPDSVDLFSLVSVCVCVCVRVFIRLCVRLRE